MRFCSYPKRSRTGCGRAKPTHLECVSRAIPCHYVLAIGGRGPRNSQYVCLCSYPMRSRTCCRQVKTETVRVRFCGYPMESPTPCEQPKGANLSERDSAAIQWDYIQTLSRGGRNTIRIRFGRYPMGSRTGCGWARAKMQSVYPS
jgi:hypothetical protein